MKTKEQQQTEEIDFLKRRILDLETQIAEARGYAQTAVDLARKLAAVIETAQRVLAGIRRKEG
jgi:hypothetical protein